MLEIDVRRCSYCKNKFSMLRTCCPHCAKPGLFPNVNLARRERERMALQARFYRALQRATKDGTQDLLIDFKGAVDSSVAVVCKSLDEVHRLVTNEKLMLASYYELTEGGAKLPDNNYWDRWRRVVDELIHPDFKKHIHFAALSLDGKGLTNYGACSLVLKDKMIKHRSSVFEGNTITLVEKLMSTSFLQEVPRGYRAVWKERGMLCVAKMHDKITADVIADDYPNLLLESGSSAKDDNFVEVHVFGPLTIHSVDKILVHSILGPIDELKVNVIIEESNKLGIAVETP